MKRHSSSPLPSQQTAGLALFDSLSTPLLTRRDAREAAQHTAAADRDRLLEAIRCAGKLTADDAGAACHMAPLSARPRVSELYAAGAIRPAGRGRSASGNPATLWEVVG